MIGCPASVLGRYFSGGLMRTCCTGLEEISGPISCSITSSKFSSTNALKTAGPNQQGVFSLTSWNGKREVEVLGVLSARLLIDLQDAGVKR